MMPLPLSHIRDSPATNTRSARFRRGQLFARLPDEVLENVFLEDILEPNDLCMLARVCRRFCRLIQGSLYSQVEICLSGNKCVSFYRTLSERPELASYVWKAHLTLKPDQNQEDNAMKRIYGRARRLLQRLPALRALELANFACSNEHTSLFDFPMSHLGYLSFHNDNEPSSLHEVTKAISLPHIKRLSIGFHNEPLTRYKYKRGLEYIPLLRGPRDALVGRSSLKELNLELCYDWVALETDLLKIPRALEMLSCEFNYSGRLTPRATTAALRPLYSTLVFLNLGYFVTPGDRGITDRGADFSSFTCLKTLITVDFLCFERCSSDRPDERRGFYKRLPSTLEFLKMSFSKWTAGLSLDHQVRKTYSWLMELAEHKLTSSTNLEEVVLKDNGGNAVEWEYPEDLVEAFKTAGIRLFIAFPPVTEV